MYTNDQASSLRREVSRKEQAIAALSRDVIIENKPIIESIGIIAEKTGTHPLRVLGVINEEAKRAYQSA